MHARHAFSVLFLLICSSALTLVLSVKDESRGTIRAATIGGVERGAACTDTFKGRFSSPLPLDGEEHSIHFYVAGTGRDQVILFRQGIITGVKGPSLETVSQRFSSKPALTDIHASLGLPNSKLGDFETYELPKDKLWIHTRIVDGVLRCDYFVLTELEAQTLPKSLAES